MADINIDWERKLVDFDMEYGEQHFSLTFEELEQLYEKIAKREFRKVIEQLEEFERLYCEKFGIASVDLERKEVRIHKTTLSFREFWDLVDEVKRIIREGVRNEVSEL